MRRLLLLGLLAAAVPLVAWVAPLRTAAPTPAPSNILVTPPTIADPVCNGGRGVRLTDGHGALYGSQGLVNTVMKDGSTLFAYNSRHDIVLVSLAASCKLNPGFGHGGVARITKTHRRWLNVDAVAATVDHNILVAGSYRGRPAVGEVDMSGRIVRSFGTNGRVTLPFCYSAQSIDQEVASPFRIIISGGYGYGGSPACPSDWLAAITQQGVFVSHFGHRGRTRVPTYGADSGIGSVDLLPNGSILVGTGFGNSGCWGYELKMYSPAGRERMQFTKHWKHFWGGLGWHAFSGGVYLDGDGFTLAGTGQKPCASGDPLFEKKARGLVAHFRLDGSLASKPILFHWSMFGQVSAFKLGRDTLVIGSPYANAAVLHLRAMRPDGKLDTRFGNAGHAEVRARRGHDAALNAEVSLQQVGPHAVLVIVGRDDGYHQVRAIRIRTR